MISPHFFVRTIFPKKLLALPSRVLFGQPRQRNMSTFAHNATANTDALGFYPSRLDGSAWPHGTCSGSLRARSCRFARKSGFARFRLRREVPLTELLCRERGPKRNGDFSRRSLADLLHYNKTASRVLATQVAVPSTGLTSRAATLLTEPPAVGGNRRSRSMTARAPRPAVGGTFRVAKLMSRRGNATPHPPPPPLFCK
jgi:hypothetical protein